MRSVISRNALLAGVCFLFTSHGWAQSPALPPHAIDLAVNYSPLNANLVAGSRFWMQGGSAQAGVGLVSHWSLVADISGAHTANMASSGIGLDLLLLTAGPQYSLHVRRVQFFGQGRAGFGWGHNSLFPTRSTSSTSGIGAAVALGGGVDLSLSRRFDLRVAELEWDRTELNNLNANAQNSIRLSTGIVVHLR